jgi:hypothetical protein
MTATTIIKCDNCNGDLTVTSSAVPKRRLVLHSEGLPSTASYSAMVHVVPALEHPHHFCDFGCLQSWMSKRSAK